MWFMFRLLLTATRLLGRQQRDLVLENLALRHAGLRQRGLEREPGLERATLRPASRVRNWQLRGEQPGRLRVGSGYPRRRVR
jgi:hypothetical protein